eukprot:SAG25_NODE_1016_length_4295_cov_104.680172_4_plen_50_part_00
MKKARTGTGACFTLGLAGWILHTAAMAESGCAAQGRFVHERRCIVGSLS